MLALTVQNPTNWIDLKKRSCSSPEHFNNVCGYVCPCVRFNKVFKLLFWVRSSVDERRCRKVWLLASRKRWPSVWPPHQKIQSLIVSGAGIWTQMTPREGKYRYVKLAHILTKMLAYLCAVWCEIVSFDAKVQLSFIFFQGLFTANIHSCFSLHSF